MTERLPLDEFQAWPKIPRLSRSITVTEKIDGTNGAIVIRPIDDDLDLLPHEDSVWLMSADPDKVSDVYAIAAQSRSRWVTPGKQDNAGFARWVYANAATLVEDIGPGRHFGEWWGQGIQRNYGLDHKRFSLFGPQYDTDVTFTTPNLHIVPVVALADRFDTTVVNRAVYELIDNGSAAAPGFMRPEGVIVRHSVSGHLFKRLIENDDAPKAQVAA